jgi:hypothetical protein
MATTGQKIGELRKKFQVTQPSYFRQYLDTPKILDALGANLFVLRGSGESDIDFLVRLAPVMLRVMPDRDPATRVHLGMVFEECLILLELEDCLAPNT